MSEAPAHVEAAQTRPAEATVLLHDDFYRDGFRTVWLSIGMTVGAIALLVSISLYFFLHQVLPITFAVYEDFRVQPDVPVDKPYLQTADLLQWVSATLPKLYTADFISYDLQLKPLSQYFTLNGWSKYNTTLNGFLNHDDIVKDKDFVTATPSGAPVVLNQGLVDGKYAWWVQMPLNVRYSGVSSDVNAGLITHDVKLIVQTLVVRIPTLNNLDGVAIENLIVTRK